MAHLVIGLATYRREREYRFLLERLRSTRGKHQLTVVVVQDGEHCYVEHVVEDGFEVVAMWQAHNGKFRYWKTISNLWRQVRDLGMKDFLYVQLADDLELADNWLEEALRIHRKVKARSAINLLLCHRAETGNWGFKPKARCKDLFKDAFVDGAFITHSKVLELLGWEVRPINRDKWRRGRKRGSQVWKQVSSRLSIHGVPMFQVRHPIITTDWSPQRSVMNPDRTPIT